MVSEAMTAELFGGILRRARKGVGLTRRAVAEGVGVSESSCANYEVGGAMPSPAIIYKLGKLLGLSAAVVEQAQAESCRRRAHHTFRATSPTRSIKPAKTSTPARKRSNCCGLSNSEQIAAIAWEANRLGITFDTIRQIVDSQGGGDIYRRYNAYRKERQAQLRREAESRRAKRGGRIV